MTSAKNTMNMQPPNFNFEHMPYKFRNITETDMFLT